MLLQALAPLPNVAPQSSGPGDVPAWLIGHLCLADAFKDAPPGKTGDGTPQPLCPICIGLQLAGAYVPPNAAELAPPGETARLRFPARGLAGASATHRSLAQARAPPALA